MTSPLRDQMQADLTAAMKVRDRLRVSVLRTTLAAIANAEAVDVAPVAAAIPGGPTGLPTEVERRHVTEAHIRRIVAGERTDLLAASASMAALHQPEAAAGLAEQAAILSAYLTSRPD